MGGAAALLSPRRAAALGLLLAALVAYDAGAGALPDLGYWGDVAWLALVVLPATFAVPLLALPLHRARALPLLAAGLGVLAVLLHLAGAGSLFNVAKLLAYTLVGMWFVQPFHVLGWIVLVAALVPWVDAISVWRGPTDYIVSEEPGLFDRIAVGFRFPGEEGSANIGPPDFLFFALFLTAADMWGLRVVWTWVGMTAALSLTLVLTAWLDVSGLPALPAISLGFLAPNADLIWRRWRATAPAPSS